MPVEFLTDDQSTRYGRYNDDPSPEQLAHFFYFDDEDLAVIKAHNGASNRLGFALQLSTVRFLGTFLTDPTEVPTVAIRHVAHQLGITNLAVLPRYLDRVPTRYEHAREIQQVYGYRSFQDQPEHFRLKRWLYTRAWLSDEPAAVLFDLATARLVEQKILLPGVTTLARFVAEIREQVSSRAWRMLARALTPSQRKRLDRFLIIPPKSRMTQLEQLRRPPTSKTSVGMLQALKRIETLRELAVGKLKLRGVPQARLDALARYAQTTSASTIANLGDERRAGTLLAFATAAERITNDDALDLFDYLVTDLVRKARQGAKKNRLRTLNDLDTAALQLSTVCAKLVDPTYADPEVRPVIYQAIPREAILQAIGQIEALARPPEVTIQPELLERYTTIRRFQPSLQRVMRFEATPAGRTVLNALAFIRSIEGERKPDMQTAPREIINKAWRRFVQPHKDMVDRAAYTLCLMEQLQTKLRRHDIYVTPSERWGDLRITLLQGKAWEAQRGHVCRMLNQDPSPARAVAAMTSELDTAFRRVADAIPTNAAVHIETKNGKETLNIDQLDKLDEPLSLLRLRRQIRRLMPQVDLAEVLLEVHQRTGFAHAFTPIGGSSGRMEDLPISICAVLVAAACNIGIEPLVRPDIPALTRRRLAWVQESCIRPETLRQANARLVDAQTTIPLAQLWGGGDVASVDGMRFIVPVRTIHAGPNPKYFGIQRGVTYLNYTSNQFTGFHGMVIPGTLRDSPYILDGLLEQETSLNPTEIMTDTAGYSDLIFGLFHLLDYQFSPRLADIGETRFWRIDRTATYGKLDALSQNVISTKHIETHWDDLLCLAGSLKLKTVRASTFIRALLAGQAASTLARALTEVGRLAKTSFLLSYIHDEGYRRRVLTQLNRGEERHRLAREVFYGRRGELRQRYKEGQEDQLGALGLVLNVIVLWNTWYMNEAWRYLEATGRAVSEEDLKRVWPLGSGHLNMVGRYTFALPELIAQGRFRPFVELPEEEDELFTVD